jgi:hypothetical protein
VALAVVALCVGAIAALLSTGTSTPTGSSTSPGSVNARVHGGERSACRFVEAFAAVASAMNVAVGCPTWLPARARLTYFNLDPDGWQIEFRTSTMTLDVSSTSTSTRAGQIISRIDLARGDRGIVRASGRAVTETVLTSAAVPIEVLRVHASRPAARRLLATTMRRIATSLAIIPVTVPRTGGCSYAPVFATMAMAAGSRHALCPRWLPNVSPPTARAGYGVEIVELYGPSAGLPHVVFDWTRATAPPGKLTAVLALRHHRVPVYLNAGLGVALFSNHYTAVVTSSPHGPGLWVSWHRYYDDRRKDLGALTHIIRSLVVVGS